MSCLHLGIFLSVFAQLNDAIMSTGDHFHAFEADGIGGIYENTEHGAEVYLDGKTYAVSDGDGFNEMSMSQICKFLGLKKKDGADEWQRKDSFRRGSPSGNMIYPLGIPGHAGNHQCTNAENQITQNGVTFCIIDGDMPILNFPNWKQLDCEPTLSPTSSPTPLESTVSATEDPHLVNTRGESFDVWQLGRVQLLRIPFYANQSSADFVLGGVIRNVTSDWAPTSCLSPYITEVTVSGRSLLKPITVLVNGPGRLRTLIGDIPVQSFPQNTPLGTCRGDPIFVRSPKDDVQVKGKTFDKTNAVELLAGGAVIHITAGKAHLNIVVNNFGALGKHVGGLLGEDDHRGISKPPASCKLEREASFTRSRQIDQDVVSYSS